MTVAAEKRRVEVLEMGGAILCELDASMTQTNAVDAQLEPAPRTAPVRALASSSFRPEKQSSLAEVGLVVRPSSHAAMRARMACTQSSAG